MIFFVFSYAYNMYAEACMLNFFPDDYAQSESTVLKS